MLYSSTYAGQPCCSNPCGGRIEYGDIAWVAPALKGVTGISTTRGHGTWQIFYFYFSVLEFEYLRLEGFKLLGSPIF